MAKLTLLVIRTQFSALHNWTTIPEDHTQIYLKHPHRHVFHVVLKFKVTDDDRELEFIEIKKHFDWWVTKSLYENYRELDFKTPSLGSMSCEMICKKIMNNYCFKGRFPCYVSIMEDDENGAEVFSKSLLREFG